MIFHALKNSAIKLIKNFIYIKESAPVGKILNSENIHGINIDKYVKYVKFIANIIVGSSISKNTKEGDRINSTIRCLWFSNLEELY